MECAGKVWYVHGDPDKVLLALRSDAEAWVKLAFPAEDTVKQAGRIRSRSVDTFQKGLRLLRR